MPRNSLADVLLQHATDLVKEAVPNLAADALERAARDQDDPLAADALDILAGFVRENGPDHVQAAADALVGLLERDDPRKLLALDDIDAEVLSQLTDKLQTAEAERRAAAAARIREFGRLVGALVFQAALNLI